MARVRFFSDHPAAAHAAALAAHAMRDRDETAAHALRAVFDKGLRRSCDLAVVVAGPGRPGARAAIAAAVVDACSEDGGGPPLWVLACECDRRGNPLPDVPRVLPVRLPVLPAPQIARLAAPALPPDLARIAARIAAVLLVAMSDPFATRLEPGRLRDLFAGVTAAEIDMREHLVGLADEVEDEIVPGPSERRASLRPRYLRPGNRRPTSRHEGRTRPAPYLAAGEARR